MNKGWQTKQLGDVSVVGAGNSAPQDKALFKDGTIPFYRTADAGRIRFGDIMEATDYLNEKGAKGLRRFPPGTILIPKSGASTFLNHRVLIGVEGCVSSHLATIVADERHVYPRFLLYFLSTITAQELIQDHSYPSLNLPTIAEIKVNLPPLDEQKQIVAKLDESFAGLAKAKENAEKNLQNARALFESHLESVFTQRGPGWADKKLEEVCGFQNGFAFKSNTFKTMGAPIIRISNIQEGRIDTENRLVFFNPKDYGENLDRYRIVKGDLLIAMSGATTGKLGFNTEDTTFYLNQRVGKFEPGKHLDKRYLYYFLSTRVEENLRISAGAAQPNLSTEQIKGFVIPLPPINEQKRIVERLDNLADQAQHLARLYDQKLEALESLKKSILHEAFSGNL